MRRSYLPSRIEQTANPVHRFTYRFAPALVESSSARSFSPVPLFSMRIAVVGCSHGELDNIYASAQHADHEAKQKGQPGIDLLICCGDFQVRTALSNDWQALQSGTDCWGDYYAHPQSSLLQLFDFAGHEITTRPPRHGLSTKVSTLRSLSPLLRRKEESTVPDHRHRWKS